MADALGTSTADEITALRAQLAARECELAAERSALAAERDRVAQLERERDLLRASHERLRVELELLKRRIFVAKAERVDTAQLELEFAKKLAELDRLGGLPPKDDDEQDDGAKPKGKARPKGRRDLRDAALEEERVEITDPLFEQLVAEGKAERIGFEESCKLAWKRGGQRRLIVARVKYRAVDARGGSAIETAPMPKELFPRSLAAPSILAHIAVEKHCDGMPLYRIEDRFDRDGIPVDRGTMSRWLEDAGATLGASVVAAMKADAIQNAFCIATDATGVAIQPIRTHEKSRQACRRGHYFVLIADKDHVVFEYTPKETSAFVGEMLHGFGGYVQADAKSVYDALFREPDPDDPDDDPGRAVPREVGCWSHARRKFWEATVAKDAVAREGLARIGRLFALEATWRGKPPSEIARLRDQHLRPHLDAFFAWATRQYELVRERRGLLRSALGYAVRQSDALRRVLDDGRLVLDNNRSERELRRIAVGRKAWLFSGSDDHAESAGHLFSLIASARLHRLDPEGYLRDLFRVLAHWPRDRYLELAPKFWARTRARLDAVELAREIGPLTVPPPLPAEEQPATR
jgi:transposase